MRASLRAALATACLSLWAASGIAGAAEPLRYDVERFDAQDLEDASSSGRTLDLHFFGKSHTVKMEPSELRSKRFRVAGGSLEGLHRIHPGAPRTFRGRLEGEPDSIVRLSTTRSGIRGYMKSSEGWVFFDPLRTAEARTGDVEGPVEHKVYTEADIDTKFEGLCAEVHLDSAEIEPAQERASEPQGEAGTAAAAGLRVFELAVDADVEFFLTYGSDATAEIEATLNMVDGIFEAEIGLTIDLVSVNVWQSEPDPYSATDGSILLNELRFHWNTNHGGITRDAAHLFTGKNLDSNTVGMAYVDVVCNSPSFSYAVSQDLNSDVLMPLLVAHELGHNLGANHDLSGSTPRYIMYPSLGIQNLDEFSATSKADITEHIDAVSCLALADGSGSSDPPAPTGGGGGGGPVDPLLILAAGCALWARWRSRTRQPPAAQPGGPGA